MVVVLVLVVVKVELVGVVLVVVLVMLVVLMEVMLVVVQWELPLTSTLSPEYVSELRLLCARRRRCGMNLEVRVSRSVMRSILERLCNSMLVWSSCVCCG